MFQSEDFKKCFQWEITILKEDGGQESFFVWADNWQDAIEEGVHMLIQQEQATGCKIVNVKRRYRDEMD
ncbi:hypothetical protein [Thermodesulfovibrio sp. TK110]